MRRLLFILLFSPFLSVAQQPFSYKLDYQNGFQSNEVYEIKQDSFGFIWIGCDAGLFRYDGVYFKQFSHPEQNGVSLTNLMIDEQQRVWCQNFTGQVFYIENDTIHLFQDFTKQTPFFPLYTIYQDDFFVVLKDSTIIFDINSKKRKSSFLNITNTLETPFIAFNIINDESGTYINNSDNIFFKAPGKQFKSILKQAEYSCFNLRKIDAYFYNLLKDKTTNEWLLVELKADKIIRQKRFPTTQFGNKVYMIKPIEGGFAVCTTNGVYLLDKDFNQIYHYFSNENISDALWDREGNLWLTSLQNGIYIIPSINLNVFSKDFFPNTKIRALINQNDSLLIGTSSGDIYYFDSEQNTAEKFDINTLDYFEATNKCVSNKDFHFFAIRAFTIAFDKQTKKRKRLSSSNVKDMILVKDSLFLVNLERFEVIDSKTEEKRMILEGVGRMITKNPLNDTIYFSNKNGFFYYINGQVKEILKDGKTIYPFSADWQGDTLWIGTLSDGFMAYKNGRFFNHYYKKENGNGSLVRAVKVHKNWLFLATNLGLIRMNLEQQTKEIIDIDEGLYQKEIQGIEVVKDEIFLFTTNDLIRFPLNMKAENRVVPNINLNHLILNDSIYLDFNKKRFASDENNLRFEFQTALFRSRQKFNYKYRLIGLNDNWQFTNATSPFVQYRSLAAGNYTFEVGVINEDGIVSSKKQYQFSITLPIWKRWWFIIIIVLFTIAIIYWLFMKRLKAVEQRTNLKNELNFSQLTALKAQMNPHFLYNSLNSIQDLILQEDVINANEYLIKFSHLMRQILEASEYIEISLNQEIQILELYLSLEKLRFGDKFQYQIILPKALISDEIKVPSMIIQPFVENAVKHGLLHKTEGEKILTIDFRLENLLICTITDNGIGRKASEQIKIRQGNQATSFATSATQKRLDILNQTHDQKIGLEIIDLYDKSESIGTKVILRIPFNQ